MEKQQLLDRDMPLQRNMGEIKCRLSNCCPGKVRSLISKWRKSTYDPPQPAA